MPWYQINFKTSKGKDISIIRLFYSQDIEEVSSYYLERLPKFDPDYTEFRIYGLSEFDPVITNWRFYKNFRIDKGLKNFIKRHTKSK